MAFCTQRKFPGQSYENSGLAEINKMKAYSSIKDHRAWSIDQNQQTCYLVDAVHKGDGDTVDLQHTMATALTRCKTDVKKTSKRVGTVDVDQHTSIVSQSDSLQIIALSMELEETKLRNSTLKSENTDLRKRIVNIEASQQEDEREDNVQKHMQILEMIIVERNELRELLDKFLSVADQIVELKVQTDQMKNVENDYVLLQAKFRDQQVELELLRNEKETFEDRLRQLETTQVETNALKESNSKLEKDLVELSNVISVSDSFIHDQELEIEKNLHAISELSQQIDNLKVALSESEMKFNKKLRLEMDVGLMEKELSKMIENSAESNPYTQQVVDRQVEDLATAIKLTLGCMNYEFEINEEDNLVEANRQLKALLLESSNKILEFKDVINKQEHNLITVANDFACKNDELTECLATIEELKRQLANRETSKTINTDSPDAQKVVLPGTNDLPTVAIDEEQEIFVNEINLADSPQISEYEDDGPEIEDLENIFEKSCIQQDQPASGLRGLNPSTRQTEGLKQFNKMKTESMAATNPDLSNASKTVKAESGSQNEKLKMENAKLVAENSQLKMAENQARLSIVEKDRELEKFRSTIEELVTDAEKNGNKSTDIGSQPTGNDGPEIENLENVFEKSCIQQDRPASVLRGLNPSTRQTEGLKQFNKMKTESMAATNPDLSNASKTVKAESGSQNEKLKMENAKLVAENSQLKMAENHARLSIVEKDRELEKFRSIIEELVTDAEKNGNKSIDKGSQPTGNDGPEIENLENVFEKSCIQQDRPASVLRGLNPSTRQTEGLKQFNKMKTESMAATNPDLSNASKTVKAESGSQNEKLKMENAKLVAENSQLKMAENQARLSLVEKDRELEKFRSIIEELVTDAEKNGNKSTEIGSQPTGNYIRGSDWNDLISQNDELRKANEKLLRKNSVLERDSRTATESLKLLHRGISPTKSQQFESDLLSADVKRIESENLNLKLENEKLVVEMGKLKNIGNSSHLSVLEMKKEVEKLVSINGQLTAELSAKKLEKDLLLAKEVESMPPDIRDLVLINEELRKENANLSLKLRALEQADKSDRPKTTTDLLGQSQDEQISTEPDWLPSNEDLVAEIEKLQQSKDKSNLTIRQMEKDLKKMELANENLSVRLNDKEAELKQLKVSPDIENVLKQNEELQMLNRNLTAEINELKSTENPDRSNVVNLKEELDALASVNKALVTEINELKQMVLCTDTKTDRQLKDMNADGEVTVPVSLQSSSHSSILKIGKDLERLAALNESLLALNNTDNDKMHSLRDDMTPDINHLLRTNQELKLANENLSTKMSELQDTESRAHFESIDTANRLEALAASNELLQARIKEMERSSSNERSTNLHSLKKENENLKTTNVQLTDKILHLEQKLHKIENRTASYLDEPSSIKGESMSTHDGLSLEMDWMIADMKKLQNRNESLRSTNESLRSTNEKLLSDEPSSIKGESMSTHDDLSLEMDWMIADMKKLQNRNESLKSTNEKLLSQISALQQCVNHPIKPEMKNDSEKMLDNRDSDPQLIYACNRNIEIEWMKTDMDSLHKKNEKLKCTNDGLAAEVGALKCSEAQAQKSIQQMEKDLLRLSAINERLSAQLNEKRLDKKQLLKVRSQELETKGLLKKIEELTSSNERLSSEISELKGSEMVKMKNDLKRLSSTNDRLKMQITEMNVLSANEQKMESNWIAADVKKLLNKNKKLSISNQNLLNEVNEIRKEFKSLENRANVNALHKVKEMDRLTALNENLKDQLNAVNNERKNCKCNDIGSNCSITDMRKVHKKNEELKLANEKLLSVIINLKNSEKLANSKVAEVESELYKLRETNKSLQDTLENYVEKDWSIPKTELERICQSILNDGVCSLSNTEYSYMQNWFGKAATADHDVAKSTRKNTTRKHCKTCHTSVDAFGTCECKHYEEKKRLNLLKEIEETKLAIQHIQKSNDIEFDLNDVKNRLLKGKPSDSSDDDSQYDLRMSQSQGSVNVRAHIITKCVTRNHHTRK